MDDPRIYIYVWNREPYDEAFSGIAEYYNDDGKLVKEIEFKEGMETGYHRTWHPCGRSASHSTPSTMENGLYQRWNEIGDLILLSREHFGRMLEHKKWDDDGNVTERRLKTGEAELIPDDREAAARKFATQFNDTESDE